MKNNGHMLRNGGSSSTFGLILIGLGGMLLLSNLGIIDGFGGIVGLIILGGLGAWLLNQYYSGRRQLWLLIAGFTMLGAAAATVTGAYAGAWFLGVTGFGFLTAWRENDQRWWALVPGGVLLTLAGVVIADQSMRWLDGGIVFFVGLAATFLTLYALPRNAQSWAIFPAAASAGIALLIWGSSGSWLLPLLLIGIGLYMLRGNGNGSGSRFGYGGHGHRQAGSARPRPQTPGQEPAEQAGVDAMEEEQEIKQLPDRLSGAGPDIPEGWAGEPREGN